MSESPSKPDALLRRLEWTVIRRLDGMLHGDYRTLFRGQGVDLAGLREYQHEDDVRHIDWNVTARLEVPHVRVFNEERDLNAWFLLDLSASLDFGSGHTSKRAVCAEFVAVLARVMGRHGNRVGAMLYGTAVDTVIPARTGRRQTLQILHSLLARPAPAKNRPSAEQATDLDVLLRAGLHGIPRRSLVFVVSDFISAPGWETTLARLAQRHEVVAVRLYDEMEMQIPDLGLLVIQDAETGEQVFVDTQDRGFRSRFEALAARREETLRDGFRQAGVDALELATGDAVFDAIVRFADLRRQRSRLAAGGMPARHLEPA